MSEPRFKTLTPETMTPEQKPVAERIASGPRGGLRGPFNAMLRAPELAALQANLGENLRFKSFFSDRLKEFAIIIVGRHWTAQYEWYAHHKLALKAGVSPQVCDAIAEGKRPSGMTADEEAIYDFAMELLNTKQVSDRNFAAMKDKFGERGIAELIFLISHYTSVSMFLNVDKHPLPADGVPLKPL
jgi:4-carboxymuconolactone decarboxylase